jgi:hypothetical protein
MKNFYCNFWFEDEQKCGELLVHYVNAETVKEAWIGLFEDTEILLGLPEGFGSEGKLRVERFAEKTPPPVKKRSGKGKPWSVLSKMQNTLRGVFSDIVSGREFFKDVGFRKLFNRGIKIGPPVRMMTEKGEIITRSYDTRRLLDVNRNKNVTAYTRILALATARFLAAPRNRELIRICEECGIFYLTKRVVNSRFCSDKCRLALHNRKRIKAGDNKSYKADKRKKGAKASYYGQ